MSVVNTEAGLLQPLYKENMQSPIEGSDPILNMYKEQNDNYSPEVVDETKDYEFNYGEEEAAGQNDKKSHEVHKVAFVETINETIREQREEIEVNFETRTCLVQCWFAKVSWTEKLHFLFSLLGENDSHDFLKLVLRSIDAGNSKDLIYSTSQKLEAYHYDIVPFDTNRSLESETLHTVQRETRQWFTLLSELDKLNVFLSLLRIGGGALVRRVYVETTKLMKERQHRNIFLKKFRLEGTMAWVSKKYCITDEETMNLPFDVLISEYMLKQAEDLEEMRRKLEEEAAAAAANIEAGGKKTKKKGGKSSAKEKKKQALEEKKKAKLEAQEAARLAKEKGKVVLSDDPLDVAAREKLAAFEKKIEELRLSFGVDENGEPYPPVVPGKKGKKDKKEKKKKGKDKKKKGGNSRGDTVDQIQLLPLRVNRAIIKLVPQSKWKDLKKVNRYWSNMVDDVKNEMKVRAKIDETIRKLSNTAGDRPVSPKKKKGNKKGSKKGSKSSSPASRKSSARKSTLTGRKSTVTAPEVLVDAGPPIEPPRGEEATRRLLRLSPQLGAAEEIDVYHGKHAMTMIIDTFFHSRVMSCDADNRLMAVTSPDNAVEFYSLLTGARQPLRLVGTGALVTCVAFHHDGAHLVTGCSDAKARLWDVSAQRIEKTYFGHTASIRCVALDGEYLATGGSDNHCKVYHTLSGYCQATVVGGQPVTAVTLLAVTDTVFVGHRGGEIRMYNYKTKALIVNIFGHGKEVTAFHLVPPLLASSGLDGFTRVWDCAKLTSGCLMAMNHSTPVQSVRLCRNRLISGDTTGRLRVWSSLSGVLLKVVQVTPTERAVLHVNCIETDDFAKIVVSCESGVKVYEFCPWTRAKPKLPAARKKRVSLCTNRIAHCCNAKKPARAKFVQGPELNPNGSLKVQREEQVKLRLDELRKRYCTDPKLKVQTKDVVMTMDNIYTSAINMYPTDFKDFAVNFRTFPRAELGDPESYKLPREAPQYPEPDPNAPIKEEIPEKFRKFSLFPKPISTQKGLLGIYKAQQIKLE